MNLFLTSYLLMLWQAREKLSEIVNKIICRERQSMNVLQKHLLQPLMAYKEETREGLREEQITDNVIGIFLQHRIQQLIAVMAQTQKF